MARQKHQDTGPAQALRTLALRYPEAEGGIACKGTALECAAFRARKKTFLFLGVSDLMIKLQESQAEAIQLASKNPSRYQVGSKGWVTVNFGPGESLPPGLLERWIDESYRAVAGKRLVAMLPERGVPTAKTEIAKKRQ